MEATQLVLTNDWLTAEFDAETGNLVRLTDAVLGEPVVVGCWCGYTVNRQAIHENPAVAANRFRVESVYRFDDGVESVIVSDEVRITRCFILLAGGPLLQAKYEIRALTAGVELQRPIAIPEIVLAEDFNNQFEDEQDLNFDGAELTDGRELPAWRVFFRTGHQSGLLAVTRSKLQMSHFQVFDRSFALRPHVMTAYSTDYVMAHSPMQLAGTGDAEGLDGAATAWTDMPAGYAEVYHGRRAMHVAEFEIGPWRRDAHEAIAKAASLDAPSSHRNPPMTGQPPKDLKGVVLRGVDFADTTAYSTDFTLDKWLRIAMPNCFGGEALLCQPTVKPPPLRVRPELKGVYRVHVGVGHGNGIVAVFSEDAMPMLRMPHGDAVAMLPFNLRLSGHRPTQEIYLRTTRMDGQAIELRRFPSSYAATVIDYVRFEKLTDDEIAEWQRIESAEPPVELSGFNDMPDIAKLDDMANPDPEIYAANLWEHANCRITKVYWRIDGQCSDFPSKHNTMRYVSAKGHGVFSPQHKAYGRLLKKTDILKLAVAAARKNNIKLYGWMRFNNYSGNVVSDYFVQHPQYHEADHLGRSRPKLCIAHPEVRRHKIDILCEAAAYGLDGLNLGFLRHPPVLLYAPILGEGYEKKYGRKPPPEPATEIAEAVQTSPQGHGDYLQWFQYRAAFLTTFGRELRAELKARGMERVKVSIWIRPERSLYDGIDLDAWLEEGLCDEVVASSQIHCVTHPLPKVWRDKVQKHVPLIHGVSGFDFNDAKTASKRAIEEGYDGICTYESDYTVLEDVFIDLYRSLR